MRDAYDLIKHLEYLLHDTSASMWNDAKKVDVLGASYDQIVNRVIDAYENWFYKETTLSPGTAAWERTPFDLPTDISKILHVTDTDGRPIEPIPLANRDFTYPAVQARYIKTGYWLGDDKLYLNADAWTENIRIYYIKRPARITYGTAEAGTGTTMTLDADTRPSIENDYYNDQVFTIREGTGAGEEATASDYVGSTRVLTIDFTSTPTVTSVYAMVSELPDGHNEVVAVGAAIRALMFDVAQAAKLAELKNWYMKLEFDLMDFLQNRQIQKSRSVFMSNME